MQVAQELLSAEAALNTTHSKVLFSSKQCFTAKRLTTIYSIRHHSQASATSGAVSLEFIHVKIWQCKAHILFNSFGGSVCAYINLKTYFDLYLWVSSRVNLKLSASAILIKNRWLNAQLQGLLTQAAYIRQAKPTKPGFEAMQHHLVSCIRQRFKNPFWSKSTQKLPR